MTKRKKKIKAPSDFGVQELVKTEDGLIRKVDGSKLRIVFALDGRRLEHEHKSVLENYYARNLLDINNSENNSRRYWAGYKFDQISENAGIRQRVTASLKENLGQGSKEHSVVSSIDSYSEFHFIIKELGNHWHIIWQVIVENKPAKKQMDKLREALDRLVEYFKM